MIPLFRCKTCANLDKDGDCMRYRSAVIVSKDKCIYWKLKTKNNKFNGFEDVI